MFPGNPPAQALAKAAAHGDLDKINKLVANSADVNARTIYGTSLPHWILYHPNIKGFKRLLELGADPNIPWDTHYSLLHESAFLSEVIGTEYLELALEVGHGNPNLAVGKVETRPIEEALFSEGRAFSILYNAGAEIDYYDSISRTSLVMHAAGANRFKIVYFLLMEGVDYKIKDKLGYDLQGLLQRKFKYEPMIVNNPSDPEYMWYWRCLDFFKKRGYVFNVPPDVLRPAVLDTTPVDIFSN